MIFYRYKYYLILLHFNELEVFYISSGERFIFEINNLITTNPVTPP